MSEAVKPVNHSIAMADGVGGYLHHMPRTHWSVVILRSRGPIVPLFAGHSLRRLLPELLCRTQAFSRIADKTEPSWGAAKFNGLTAGNTFQGHTAGGDQVPLGRRRGAGRKRPLGEVTLTLAGPSCWIALVFLALLHPVNVSSTSCRQCSPAWEQHAGTPMGEEAAVMGVPPASSPASLRCPGSGCRVSPGESEAPLRVMVQQATQPSSLFCRASLWASVDSSGSRPASSEPNHQRGGKRHQRTSPSLQMTAAR